jgi:hypothetical protein
LGCFSSTAAPSRSPPFPSIRTQENLGSLSIGVHFDFSEFTTPAVLMHHGSVISSNITDIPLSELDSALRNCSPHAECDLRLRNANWISLPIETGSSGGVYLLAQPAERGQGDRPGALHAAPLAPTLHQPYANPSDGIKSKVDLLGNI